MRADLVGRPTLRRSNSNSNLAGRLGIRRQTAAAGNPRRRLNRNNIRTGTVTAKARAATPQRGRSLTRSNSQNNVRRNNSRQRLPVNRNNSQQRRRSQSRSNSRINLNRPNTPNLQRNNANKGNNNINNNRRRLIRTRSNSKARQPQSNSVNTRLGKNRTRPVVIANGGGQVVRGRVFKRRAPNAGGNQQMRNRAIGGAKQRLGRSRTR